MSINAVSNNNVSFGHIKTTKQGNEYKKTHAATYTGLAVGVASATAQGLAIKRNMKNPVVKRTILRKLVDLREGLMQSGISKLEATNFVKKLPKKAYAVTMAFSFLGSFAIGASINKIINHNRAKKADQAAAQQAK